MTLQEIIAKIRRWELEQEVADILEPDGEN